MDIQSALEKILPANRIRTRLIDLVSFASDAGFYHLVPQAVVMPENVAEVKALFMFSQKHKIPMTFRAAGTSLSGQSITDGILVDLSQFWRKIEPLKEGQWVKVQPGAIGGMVNAQLKKYKRKIGPDPATINAAMMGGILSNNSSGMCCGVDNNSYHTMSSLHFVLPNGLEYNTANDDDYPRFVRENTPLASKLTELRNRILRNYDLKERIRDKYLTKNTVGYSLNSLLDYEHPLDILAHLMIGAEGTLGFIADAVMRTLPDLPHKATAMLYFPGIYEACAAIVALKDSGAQALELMDRASLRSVENVKGIPAIIKTLPDGVAAILCEYQTETAEELAVVLNNAESVIAALPLLEKPEFTRDALQQAFYWKIRKGMFPSVGAVRQSGTTVLLEDVAFPVARLADAVLDIQKLFVEFNYNNGIIFGHAKDGNIHFVVTQAMDEAAEVDRYDRFLQAVVKLVVEKYDGTLKAEHGTGRNMAPFVETEWGGVAYQIMKEIKETLDPHALLNPGVIINSDPKAHLKDLKSLPTVEEEVDKCIECGLCEHNCPSRDLTMTPRRRIVVRRELKRLKKAGANRLHYRLLKQYKYEGLDTCAVDGLCATDCPVDINTGELVKRLRKEDHGNFSSKVALFMSKNFGLLEGSVKFLLGFAVILNRVFGKNFILNITRLLHKIIPGFPVWMNQVVMPPKKMKHITANPQVVYFSSCVSRMMGGATEGKASLQQTFLNVCKKAGVEVLMPEQSGHCCGQVFSSKGYEEAAKHQEEKTIDALLEWSQGGKLPVVCDFTSCTFTFIHNSVKLSPEYKEKFAKLTLIDSIVFANDYLVPNLKIKEKKQEVVLHPVCSAIKLNIVGRMEAAADACAHSVVIPKNAGCCGMAGDRGFLFPELTASATHLEASEVNAQHCSSHYSSGKTCEMAMSHATGHNYESLIYLLDEVSC